MLSIKRCKKLEGKNFFTRLHWGHTNIKVLGIVIVFNNFFQNVYVYGVTPGTKLFPKFIFNSAVSLLTYTTLQYTLSGVDFYLPFAYPKHKFEVFIIEPFPFINPQPLWSFRSFLKAATTVSPLLFFTMKIYPYLLKISRTIKKYL